MGVTFIEISQLLETGDKFYEESRNTLAERHQVRIRDVFARKRHLVNLKADSAAPLR